MLRGVESTSAISQRALLSFISSSMPLIALLLGIRLPSRRRRERSRLTTANDVFLDTVQRDKKIFGSVAIIMNRSPESLAGVDLDILSSTEYSFAPSPAQHRANDITPYL